MNIGNPQVESDSLAHSSHIVQIQSTGEIICAESAWYRIFRHTRSAAFSRVSSITDPAVHGVVICPGAIDIQFIRRAIGIAFDRLIEAINQQSLVGQGTIVESMGFTVF